MNSPQADQPQATGSGWLGLALIAAPMGLTAVLLGAVGSHAVSLNDATAQNRWDIALQIHYFQAAALLALAALSATQVAGRKLLLPGLVQAFGTVLFSGSLYLRAIEVAWLPGWITPAGGLVLLSGWLVLMLSLIKSGRR
jgi:uncharacterized membrane protein YgdD (TMEM256/DUF423 family)